MTEVLHFFVLSRVILSFLSLAFPYESQCGYSAVQTGTSASVSTAAVVHVVLGSLLLSPLSLVSSFYSYRVLPFCSFIISAEETGVKVLQGINTCGPPSMRTRGEG